MFEYIMCKIFIMILTRKITDAAILFKSESIIIKTGSHPLQFLNRDSLINLVLPPEPLSLHAEVISKYVFGTYQTLVTQPGEKGLPKDTYRTKADIVIILIEDYQSLVQLEHSITLLRQNQESWNPSALFLLITLNNSNLNKSLAAKTFNFLWQRNIFKALILICSDTFCKELSAVSSSPFSKINGTCRVISNPKQMQDIHFENITSIISEICATDYFTLKSFEGCPLIAYTVDPPVPPYTVTDKHHPLIYDSGIEIEILKVFAKLYNVSVTIMTRKIIDNDAYLYFLTNGTLTGLLEDLISYKIELVFGGMKPPGHKHLQIDITQTYGFTSMGWFVPDGDKSSFFSIIINFLSGTTWLIVFAVIGLFSSLYYVMSTSRERHHLFFSIIGALLGAPMNRPPQTCHLRMMLFTWYLFGMHAVLMFNTNLYSMLTHPPTDRGIQTIHELYESKLNLCIPQSWIGKKYDPEPVIAAIFGRGMVCNDLESAVSRLMERKNFGIIAKTDHLHSLVDEKLAGIHKLPAQTFTYPVGMTLSKGCVFREQLDQAIIRSMEAGLIQKWINNVRLEMKVKFTFNETDNKKGLGKNELVGVFATLLVGQMVASIVLLLEILYPTFVKNG